MKLRLVLWGGGRCACLGAGGKGKDVPTCSNLSNMEESLHPAVALLVVVRSENLLTTASRVYFEGTHYIWLFVPRTSETVVPACFDKDPF